MPTPTSPLSPLRSSGFWMAAIVAVFLVINAVRSLLAPEAFAGYFGAPLASPEDTSWVIVYGLRTGLIAVIIIILLTARQLRLTGWVALLGAALPAGDLILAEAAGAPVSILARHVAIGIFLLVTAWRLFSFPRSNS